MKQNNESITPLRKYIAIGYAVIALLIGGIVFIYLHEWRELERIEAESKEMKTITIFTSMFQLGVEKDSVYSDISRSFFSWIRIPPL